MCVGHFWLHLTLQTIRATGKSNLVEKMQAGNYRRNLKKKIKLEIKILNFGCWRHFDHLGNGRGHHDHMVVGFITTYAISAYHH